MKVLVILLYLGSCFSLGAQPPSTSDSLPYYTQKINTSSNNEELLAAFRYLKTKQLEDERQQLNLAQVYNLIYMARVQQKIGLLTESEATATQALQLVEQLKTTPTKTAYQNTLYNHLGKIYKEMGMLTQARYFYKKALAKASPKQQAILLNNLGNTYREQQKDSMAIAYYTQAIALSKKNKNLENIARSTDNLGYTLRFREPKTALEHLNTALELRKELASKEGLFTSYIHLGEFYQLQQQPEQAQLYFQQAQQIASQFQNLKYKESALKKLVSLTEMPLVKNYLQVKDSLDRLNEKAESNYLAIQFQLQKTEREAALLQVEKEKESQKTFLFQLIGILVFILALAIFAYLKIKHRKEKIEEVFSTESRIAKKIHDEVANDIYYLMAKLQNSTYQKEDTLDRLEDIYHTSRNISRENKSFPTQENFTEVLQEMLSHYQTQTIKIITKNLSAIDWEHTSVLKKATLYRIIQELFTNMKKHSEASLVLLDFQQKGKKLVINYTDNGKGSELKKKNGLVNTESRIRAIKGSITFETETNKGFKVQIIC